MLSWIEVDGTALAENLGSFRKIVNGALVAPVVKANAYGHGLVVAAKVFAEAGADWLCVNAGFEAVALRNEGIELPIYVLGMVDQSEMVDLAQHGDIRLVTYHEETVMAASAAGLAARSPLHLHLKLETGNNRQGLDVGSALCMAELIKSEAGVILEGVSSHYADIEDTTDHSFAKSQMAAFTKAHTALVANGHEPAIRSFSNSAATLLWPETHFELVRVGISAYGMWPSKETLISAERLGRDKPALRPALTWKTRVAQVKNVPVNASVGYGRTWQAGRPTRLAILPIGYYDGYSRQLSNVAYVLVNGHRAPIRGRVCMNMTMVDVTDVPNVEAGAEVVLLGTQETQTITAEQLADWAGTINYEITTCINEGIPRVLV
jgi:alanine racemase